VPAVLLRARGYDRHVPTINIVLESSLAPAELLAAARDFSPRREAVFPAVSVGRMTVHELGDTWADVTEGTRAGPIVNWERCRYDWSQPGAVTATVTDSNIYAIPGSAWELRATSTERGSRVEMIWEREFVRRPRGRIFGFLFARFGARLFAKYAREVVENIEQQAQSSAGGVQSSSGG
jgi:hypothetical protein